MKSDNTLLGWLIGALLLGGVIVWAFRLFIMIYIYASAIIWTILSELIWPCLRWIFREVAITLLRTYNRITSS